MSARLIDRVATGFDAAAAALFGGAVAYASWSWLRVLTPEPWTYVAAAGVLAALVCFHSMRMVAADRRRMHVPVFNVWDIEPELDELFLTDADRIGSAELVLTDAERMNAGELLLTDADQVSRPTGPLELDDILAELGPDSRVVRLFDPKTMPTAGQLKVRIDHHLGRGRPQAPLSDASQALSEALAELRRSLR